MNTNVKYSDRYRPTQPYIWDDVTFCLKNPNRVPSWMNIFLLSDHNNGAFFSLTILGSACAVVLVFMFTGFEETNMNFHRALIYLLALFFNVSHFFRKYCKTTLNAILNSYLLFAVFFYVSIYNALFFNILLSEKYEPRVTTLEELKSSTHELLSTANFLVS